MSHSPDWAHLVELALGVPPQPCELRVRLDAWGQAFEHEHGRQPDMSDFPAPLPWFFWRLTLAHVPLAAISWAERFHDSHGRYPSTEELPEHPHTSSRKGAGRPTKECAPWVQARKAWREAAAESCYDSWRFWLSVAKKDSPSIGYAFGFDAKGLRENSPAELALELVSDSFDVPKERARKLVFRNTEKKGGND